MWWIERIVWFLGSKLIVRYNEDACSTQRIVSRRPLQLQNPHAARMSLRKPSCVPTGQPEATCLTGQLIIHPSNLIGVLNAVVEEWLCVVVSRLILVASNFSLRIGCTIVISADQGQAHAGFGGKAWKGISLASFMYVRASLSVPSR